MISRRAFVLASAAVPIAGRQARGGDGTPFVAAASSLRFALDGILEHYNRDMSVRARVTYGSTGTLTSQIENGAPYDVFVAADLASAQRIAEAGLTVAAPAIVARGRLAIATAHSSPIRVDSNLAGVAAALDGGVLQRFTIANPAFAPYGRAARAVLQRLSLWDRLEGKLAIGENVGQAAQFVATGAAGAGLIAYSLCLAPRLQQHLRYAALEGGDVEHGAVVLRRAGEQGHQLFAYLQSDLARAIFEKHGLAADGPV